MNRRGFMQVTFGGGAAVSMLSSPAGALANILVEGPSPNEDLIKSDHLRELVRHALISVRSPDPLRFQDEFKETLGGILEMRGFKSDIFYNFRQNGSTVFSVRPWENTFPDFEIKLPKVKIGSGGFLVNPQPISLKRME